jgi:type II secretory ATPase GspE/PulE/Tfp pilus assembly ATPase PilB-like protein
MSESQGETNADLNPFEASAPEESSTEEVVGALIDEAARLGASDLYIFAEEDATVIKARHLGVLREMARYPRGLDRRFISHIKALADMDPGERRRPQDGRWVRRRGDDPEREGANDSGRAGAGSSTIDVRVNVIPTLWGEDCAIRLLKREDGLGDLASLGLLRGQLNQLLTMLSSPAGLILVTGPTGAGKTTTIYAALKELNDGTRKINTIEDPIEYSVPGMRHSQVNPAIKLDFAELLANVLRQSPDVIMVGEIRDPETAAIAVRAAHSGHLVFATLHAPIAAGAIPSMLSLGVHPHFLASATIGVVAQRLVRVLCDDCKVPVDMSESPFVFDAVKRWVEPTEQKRIYGAQGCEKCLRTGYTSRTGVFEVLPVDGTISEMIARGAAAGEIAAKAAETGMVDFRQASLINIARGVTNMEEVLRSVPVEYLGLEG